MLSADETLAFVSVFLNNRFSLAPLEQTENHTARQYLSSKNEKIVSTMSIPGPLIAGTISYLVLFVVLIGGIFVSMATGMLSKDNAS